MIQHTRGGTRYEQHGPTPQEIAEKRSLNMQSECQWFLECHEEQTAEIDHPILGWVPICGRHVDWLLEDMTDGVPNPTKMVPPLAAKHGEKVRAILARLEDD